jgi:Putative prokaryotic signal transducing protein
MTMPTPEQESSRIAGVYSAMSDEELGQIAASGDELSAAALAALQAEAGKRGLQIEIAPPHGEDVFEFNEAVTLRQFRDLPEALLAKGSLESAGIEAYLVDDNMIRMDWFISNLLGGIKLKVRPEDAEEANEILNQPIPEVLEVDDVGDFEQPKCPKCQSLDINLDVNDKELDKPVAYMTAYAGVPVPFYKKGWTCGACNNKWEDSGD